MKKGLVFATLAIVFHVLGIATGYATEQYRTEVSAFYSRADGSQDSRTILYGVSGEIFFAPVNTEEHPYAEAAFLERIGSVFLTGAKEEIKVGWAKGDGFWGSFGVNLSRPDFPLVAQFMFTRSRFDADDNSFSNKGDFYDFRVGSYFTKVLLAGLEYNYGSSEVSFAIFPSITVRTRDYGFFAKYVYELSDYKELNLEVIVGKSTDGNAEISRNTNESLSVDYFFNKSLSAGVGFRNSSGTDESIEGKTYSGNMRYFINPHFSVQAIYERFRNSNADQENEHTYELILAGRF